MSNKAKTLGISFPEEKILEQARERAKELGIRSFSEYINQLIKYDLGVTNYIGQYIAKPINNQQPKETK